MPRKRKTAAAKIRELDAAGYTRDEIVAKGYTRQQWESALAHAKPMGRPRKPRCPRCGSIVRDSELAAKIGAR